MATISDLMDEILIQVFQYFELEEMRTLPSVCKRWQYIINSNNVLWKKYIPQNAIFTIPKFSSAKLTLMKMIEESVKIGKERWYPNPLPLLVSREKLISHCNQWGFGGKIPSDTYFTLYIRLNHVYDLVNNHTNVDLVNIIDEIWENFGEKSEIGYEIKSVNDIVNRSHLVDYTDLSKTLQNQFEPSYIKYCIEHEFKTLNLDEFSLHEVYDEEDTTPDNLAVFDDPSWSNDTSNLVKNYSLPNFALYQQVVKALLGSDGDQPARRFYLTEGCFNENYEYSKEIVIGKDVVFAISEFYDL